MARVPRRIVIPYGPRDAFRAYHSRAQRWAILVAHRRAGKTVACLNDVVRRALCERKLAGRYAYIAPYYGQAKDVAWDYLLRYTADVRIGQSHADLWVEVLGGSRIRLYGADNPDSLRGVYLDGVVLDEYADMRPRVWGEIVRPLLTDRQGWATFIGTPRGHNAFYDLWKRAQLDPGGWFAQRLRASETGILDAAELADARGDMTAEQYEQEMECSFEAAILGSIYGRDIAALASAGRITVVAYDPSLPVHTAWDLGYYDSTTCWMYQVVPGSGELHIIDYFEGSGLSVADYCAKLDERPYKWGIHWLPHDARAKTLASGGRSVVEQMAEHLGGPGSLRIAPHLSVSDGIQAVRMLMQSGKLWIDATLCEEPLEALKQYQYEWDDARKKFRDSPRHDWTSHTADALRMLAVSWRSAKVEAAPQKPRYDIEGLPSGVMRTTRTVQQLFDETPRRRERI